MNPFQLALRNIVSHKRRNLIILSVTGFVTAALFLLLAFSDGGIQNIRFGLGSFTYATSDVRVYQKDYLDMRDRGDQKVLESLVPDFDATLASIKGLPFVEEAFAYSRFGYGNIFKNPDRYRYFMFRYVDLENERYLVQRYAVTAGRNLKADDRYAIMLHDGVRKETNLRPGDEVVLSGQDLFGQAYSQKVTVVGFYLPGADNPNLLQLSLCDAATISATTGYNAGEMRGIEILLKKNYGTKKAVAELNANWEKGRDLGLKAYDANALRANSGNESIYRTVRLIFVFVCLLTIGIVSFGIMNIISVNLFDRKKEIGTYYCLGTERGFLLRMYTWEILLVNMAGSALGIALGCAARLGVNALKLSSDQPGIQTVLGGTTFRLGLDWTSVLWITGGIAAITVLTAITTLGKALKVSPVVAIRETE